MIKMNFPVFARYRNPVEAFGRWAMMDYQVPTLMHGEASETVQVNPGDFIFGDYDGVMFVPKHLTLQVLAECERAWGSKIRRASISLAAKIPLKSFNGTSGFRPRQGA